MHLGASTQDRPSFLQAELRQRVLGKQLQEKQPQSFREGQEEALNTC